MTDFSSFGLAEPIFHAVTAHGLKEPTPIQAKAIPPILAGRDLCGIAQTGTGKTAAFALPVLHRLTTEPKPRIARACRALVVAPTRELATQIGETFRVLSKKSDIRTTVIFGGVSQGAQARAMAGGVDVLVATPGRLLDLVDQRLVNLGSVEFFVVDEADQMLDLGFIVPLRKIVKLIPWKRQTLLFSATMPSTIADLANNVLTDAVHVSVAPVASTPDLVDQSVIFSTVAGKPQLLASLLADETLSRVLVFTRTKHGADKVARVLERAKVGAAVIHGNKSQGQRERALAAFKKGDARVMVATDIAARGIHVNDITHVVNYDLPNIPESYVHRIGRTARAGARGIAISFCSGEERAYLKQIEKLTRQRIAIVAPPEGIALLPEEPEEERRRPQPHRQHAQKQAHGGGEKRGGEQGRKARRGKPNGGNGARPSGNPNNGVDSTGLPGFIRNAGRRDGRSNNARA